MSNPSLEDILNFIKKYLPSIKGIKAVLSKIGTALIYIFIFLSIYYTYKENSGLYSTITTRLGIFYLGSIVTMSVYIYTKTQSMSSVQFSSPSHSIKMGFGVLFSFTSLLTIPSKFYYPDPFFQNYLTLVIKTDWNLDMILGLVNFLTFAFATSIFIYVLMKFIKSFNIDQLIDKNYMKVLKVGELKHLNTNNIKEKNGSVESEKFITPFTQNEIKKLNNYIDIYNQNLIYLLTLKNSQLTSKYLNNWGALVSKIQTVIFHSSNIGTEGKTLFNKTLTLTSKLIIETSDSISLKRYNDAHLNTILNSVPLFAEEKIEKTQLDNFKSNYVTNYDLLIESYFNELYKLIEYLYFSKKNVHIFNTLANDEVGFKAATINQASFVENKAKLDLNNDQDYLEDMFISILFKLIQAENNIDLPVILNLLFEVQVQSNFESIVSDKNNENSINTIGSALILKSLESIKKSYNSNNTSSVFSAHVEQARETVSLFKKSNKEIELNDKTIKYLIVAIVKACEIENYKAVGYLIKRLCNHVKFEKLKQFFDDLKNTIFEEKIYSLLLSKISLNGYSLDYCFNKTLLLICLQSYYNDRTLKIDIDQIVESNFKKSIVDSLHERHKEYNLSCIKESILTELNLIIKEKEYSILSSNRRKYKTKK